MTATRQELALDWVEQWRDFCAGKPAMVLKELDAPHGRVRIHGRRGDPHDYVATFVRNPDGMVFPLGTGDYSSCADACIGVLSGRDAVWDNDKFPPFSVIARRCRKFFSPVDGRTVVGALELVGGVVLLGVNHKVWSLLFHDGQRSEWLRASSRTFDLDAWLRDHPGAPVSAPSIRQPPAEPAPASAGLAPATPPSPASPSTGPAPAVPPSPASPSGEPEPATPPSPASPSAGPALSPSPAASPGAPAVSTPPSAPREPSTPAPDPAPVTPAERRRQALAAQRDAELRQQQDEAARKDAELREQQRRVVLGPVPDPGEGPSDSDAVRACLMRLPDRAPTGQPQLVVEWFAKVMLAVGEVGYFGDLAGRKADIAATLSRVLGAPICARMLGLALTILHRMGTCLVTLANKKWWTVKLSGLADRASTLHRDLLAETGIGFQLRPTRHAFRGRQPVRWEVPRHLAAGEAKRQDKPIPNAEQAPEGLRGSSATETATPATPATTPGAGPSGPVDAATVAEGADLRHRLTVAHSLTKLAHQRREEDRAAWQREKAELEQRVAVAETQAHAASAELARVREQYDELQGKLTMIQETAERTTGLVDKLERATAALIAATEQQESLARSAEVLTAERDHLAAEVERLTRLADAQGRRAHGQTAEQQLAADPAAVTVERDQLVAEAAHLLQPRQVPDQAAEPRLVAVAPATVAHEQLVPDAPRNADGVRRARPPGLPPAALACVAWTLAGLALPRASSTSGGGAQGPRGPPER